MVVFMKLMEEKDKTYSKQDKKSVRMQSPPSRQLELRSHTQFFYFCLKGVPAIVIPSLRDILEKDLEM